jgi:hypothetical protein
VVQARTLEPAAGDFGDLMRFLILMQIGNRAIRIYGSKGIRK